MWLIIRFNQPRVSKLSNLVNTQLRVTTWHRFHAHHKLIRVVIIYDEYRCVYYIYHTSDLSSILVWTTKCEFVCLQMSTSLLDDITLVSFCFRHFRREWRDLNLMLEYFKNEAKFRTWTCLQGVTAWYYISMTSVHVSKSWSWPYQIQVTSVLKQLCYKISYFSIRGSWRHQMCLNKRGTALCSLKNSLLAKDQDNVLTGWMLGWQLVASFLCSQ